MLFYIENVGNKVNIERALEFRAFSGSVSGSYIDVKNIVMMIV